MNPRALPGVVAELIMEMHEVRAPLRGLRDEMRALRGRVGRAVIKSLEPFLNRLLDHDDQVKNYEQRLGCLKNSQA